MTGRAARTSPERQLSVRARSFAHESDLRAMQRLVSASLALEKPLVSHHVGDLAWARHQHVGREGEWRIRLWERESEVVGWGWLELPGELDLHTHPAHRRELVPEIVAWAAAEADEELRVSAFERDEATMKALAGGGFSPIAEGAFDVLALPLDERLPEPELPAGFRLRHLEVEADLDRRVAVHRAAYHPSRVTEESYANVTAAWPYRRELDWVVEAPDGRFASFCLAWLDDATAVGELEPVGTDPEFGRRGLARAVSLGALRALAAHGADTAVVYAGHPAASALYRGLGFRTIGRRVRLAG
jgi:ribosomal protein S18 acetylase RimI-like enzyme